MLFTRCVYVICTLCVCYITLSYAYAGISVGIWRYTLRVCDVIVCTFNHIATYHIGPYLI